MDCRLARGLVEAVAERLAVDRHHLSFGQLVQRGDPTDQALLELGGLQCREHGVETVMRWNAIAEVEEFAQPVPLLNSPLGDRHEIIGSGDDGADGDGDDADQGIDDLPPAGVGEVGEMILKASRTRRHETDSWDDDPATRHPPDIYHESHVPVIAYYLSWRNRPGRSTDEENPREYRLLLCCRRAQHRKRC